MRYIVAADARQIILNLLNNDPTKSRPMDMVAAGITRNRAESCLTMMVSLGEIERTGKGLGTRYKALAQTTMSADVMRKYVLDQQSAGCKLAPPKPEITKAGYYKHRPDKEDHVRPTNQGGQGAIRRQVFVPSAMG